MSYRFYLFLIFMFQITPFVQASENKEFELKEDLKLNSPTITKIPLKSLASPPLQEELNQHTAALWGDKDAQFKEGIETYQKALNDEHLALGYDLISKSAQQGHELAECALSNIEEANELPIINTNIQQAFSFDSYDSDYNNQDFLEEIDKLEKTYQSENHPLSNLSIVQEKPEDKESEHSTITSFIDGNNNECTLLTNNTNQQALKSSIDNYYNDPNTLAKLNVLLPDEPTHFTYLTTHQKHMAHLEEAFTRAQKSILVTNYGFLYHDLLKSNLFTKVIPTAYARNMEKEYGADFMNKNNLRPTVTLYLRYNDNGNNSYSWVFDKIISYLSKYFIVNAAKIPTHAKILMVDDQFVTVGSFNWLTDYTSRTPSLNHSIVYKGEDIKELQDHIWKVLRYYRNKVFAELNDANFKAAERTKRFSYMNYPQEFELGNNSTLTYFPTIDAHRYELLDILNKAQEKLIFVSPFVDSHGKYTYKRDFVDPILKTILDKGVQVYFVCLEDNITNKEYFYTDLKRHLQHFTNKYQNLKILPLKGIHTKTLIRDDNLLAEGSFNWLRAARDETSASHKHEATFLIEGAEAIELINNFYQTEIGQLIKKYLLPENKKRKLESTNIQIGDNTLTKRQRYSTSKLLQEPNDEVFYEQKANIDKDLWVNYPFWVPPHTRNYSPDYSYLIYEMFFEIMSGKRFNRKGYCVSINREYLTDEEGNILYFNTIQEAKEAAYDEWQSS